MSYSKRYYEDHFDEVVTYEGLKKIGLTEEEIYDQWYGFSDDPKTDIFWQKFKGGENHRKTEGVPVLWV